MKKFIICLILVLICSVSFAANGPTEKITVGSGNISDGSIGTSKLADDAVTTGKILDNTILNEDVATGTYAELNGQATEDFAAKDLAATTVLVSDGSVSLPSIANTGDPNTGMYFPANDTYAFTAGGVETLRSTAKGVTLPKDMYCAGISGFGITPSSNFAIRAFGSATNKAAIEASCPNPVVSVNATNYTKGASFTGHDLNIANGVTDSGYRFGGEFANFISDANFLGTLEMAVALNVRSGISVGAGTITNCYGLKLQTLNTTGTITNNWGIYQTTAAANNYFAGESRFGSATDLGAYKVQVTGDSYFTGDVSALTFTDRTDSPKTLADAYTIVNSHESVDGQLNHNKLSPLAWGTKKRKELTGKKVLKTVERHYASEIYGQPDYNYTEEILVDEVVIVTEPDSKGRNMTMVISAQALVIKDLLSRIEKLEGRK